MEILLRTALFLGALIKLAPSIIAFLPSKIKASYGIEVPDANYELMLRSRAVLFGIVGMILLYSCITKKYYTQATTIGLISMISFVALYFLIGGSERINEQLTRVMKIDAVVAVILLVSYILYSLSSKS